MLASSATRESERRLHKCLLSVWRWGDVCSYLGLHEHGHVREHFMQLPDAGLQLHDVLVTRLNFIESLSSNL